MLFFSLFISVFYIVGFFMIYQGVKSYYESTAAAKWPVTIGEVQSCDIDVDRDSDGNSYKVIVSYVYQVNGKEYTHDKLAFGYAGSSGRDSHEEIMHKIQSEDRVEVRYDPNDPQNAVLSYGFHRSIQLFLVFGVTWLLFVFGFTMLFVLFSKSDTVLLENLRVVS